MNTQELKGTEVQVTELRRTYQSLEIDLQSHISMVSTSAPRCSLSSVLTKACVQNCGRTATWTT